MWERRRMGRNTRAQGPLIALRARSWKSEILSHANDIVRGSRSCQSGVEVNGIFLRRSDVENGISRNRWGFGCRDVGLDQRWVGCALVCSCGGALETPALPVGSVSVGTGEDKFRRAYYRPPGMQLVLQRLDSCRVECSAPYFTNPVEIFCRPADLISVCLGFPRLVRSWPPGDPTRIITEFGCECAGFGFDRVNEAWGQVRQQGRP